LNARLQGRILRNRTRLDRDARRMFDLALTRLALTARGHDRVSGSRARSPTWRVRGHRRDTGRGATVQGGVTRTGFELFGLFECFLRLIRAVEIRLDG
jgi:hypothetical protein